MDLTDVLGSHIQHASFHEQEFEEFVGVLLREEVSLRHDDAKVHGPYKDKRPDGGFDLRVVVNGPPRTIRKRFRAALTWDEIGTTIYRCKCSGRDGRWRPLVARDARLSSFRKAMKGKPPEDRAKQPSAKLLDHLAAGGRYVIVINEPSGAKDDFFDVLARGFAWWLERTGRTVPPEFIGQLELIEANKIAEFVRVHRPNIPSRLTQKLGVSDPRNFSTWEDWGRTLFRRDRLKFEPDPSRSEIIQTLDLGDSQGPRVAWIIGPPGAGKTRTAYEALGAQPDLAKDRVRYSDDAEGGLEAIKSGWLETVGSICLVLDEVRAMDVDTLVTEFLSKAPDRTRLVLIGPSDGARAWKFDRDVRRFELDRLDDEATRRIVIRELKISNPADARSHIDAVVYLSHGFPLFAVLLARALAADEHTIEDPKQPQSEWHAALRVLAGPRRDYADSRTWAREAEVRAKCLLVVLLTHGLATSWDELWDTRREQLASAIDEPREWDLVKRAEAACVDREILRYTGHDRQRYVSPRNLGRIILNRFLGGPEPGGAERIQRAAPDLFSGLHGLAERLHASREVRERLARAEWSGLVEAVRAGTNDDWLYSRSHEEGLYQATRVVPVVAVRAAAAALRALDDRALEAASRLRSSLRGSLNHARHRKLGSEAFRELEAVLMRLSRFEQGGFIGNTVQLWQHLFLVRLDQTHEPWPCRRRILVERLESADLQQRLAAVSALSLAIEESESDLGTSEDDTVDGPWPGSSLTGAEVVEAKRGLWSLLLGLCDDEDADFADSARRVVTERLRGAMGRFVFVDELSMLAESVVEWTAEQRHTLGQAIEDTLRHDLDALKAKAPKLVDPLQQVRAAVSPSSYHERLLQHVGSYWPGPWEVTDADRPDYEQHVDDELVREALDRPELLLVDMDWLTSSAAARARPFASRLGQHARDNRFLEPLVEAAREKGALLPLEGYLLGWSERDAAAVERWLKDHMEEPALASVVCSVLARMEPSPDHLGSILYLVTSGDVDGLHLLHLRHDRWLDAIPADTMIAFLHTIAPMPAMAGAVVSIGGRLLDRELPEVLRERLGAALAKGVRHWAEGRIIMTGHWPWAQAIIALLELGRVDDVIEALTTALSGDRGGPNLLVGREVLGQIIAWADPDTLWDRFARPMLERTRDRYVAHFLAEAGLRQRVSTETIAAWVGDDREHASLTAKLARLTSAEVDPLVITLLERLGADSEAAVELRASIWSFHRRGPLADAYRTRLAIVEQYEQHTSAPVRAWASAVADRLRESIRTSEAVDEHHGRYA